MWIVLSYDPEAACGSLHAEFKAFGPHANVEDAQRTVEALSFSGQASEIVELRPIGREVANA